MAATSQLVAADRPVVDELADVEMAVDDAGVCRSIQAMLSQFQVSGASQNGPADGDPPPAALGDSQRKVSVGD